MDKKILDRVTRNLDNTALMRSIEEYKASGNDVNRLRGVLNILEHTDVIVPVAFPKNADRTIMLKMLRGEPLKKNESIPMLPITMSDKDGNKFAPAFTSGEHIKRTEEFPFMIRVPGQQVIRTVLNEKLDLTGVLLNPQTSGFLIKKKAFTDDLQKVAQEQKSKTRKVSVEEFHVIARGSVERSLIPKTLFAEKGSFIEQIEERRESLLLELYSRPYSDKVPVPYTEEDFSVMVLDIDETTTAVCAELPTSKMAVGAALSAYIIRNPQTDEVYYYLIEKGQKGESNVLCKVTEDGKHEELMTAPPTGSELTEVLNLIREEKEEQEASSASV